MALVHVSSSAQHLVHGIGFHVGSASVQSDYGSRNDLMSNLTNNSISVSFTHTLHFFNNNLRWNSNHFLWDHIALRSELNIVTGVTLKHQGKYVSQNSEMGTKLRAMTGSLGLTSLGFQLEYYMKPLEDFFYPLSDNKWIAYSLAGLQYNMYSNDVASTLGDWQQNDSIIPSKWRIPGAIETGSGTALSGTLGLGTRYKISATLYFNFQLNWKFFFSDTVDGLNSPVVENKHNESLLNYQLGVVYHLNFFRPLNLF